VAKDYKSAVKFLIDNRWIEESMAVWNEDDTYSRLDELLGEDAFDIIIEKWDIDDFNDFWTGNFILEEVKVYE
jgi:hypothetical protein